MVIIDVEPVTGFLNSLEPAVRAKAYRGIDLLAKNWPAIGEPYWKDCQMNYACCVNGIAMCKYACSSFRLSRDNWQWWTAT